MKIVLIGSGNVATQLGKALKTAGIAIAQVYSRTEKSAALLAQTLNSAHTNHIEDIADDADLYVISVKDDAIPGLLSSMTFGKGLYIHTAGSVDIDVFTPYTQRRGVVYPLQTFSKDKEVVFREVPLFIESASESDSVILQAIAGKLSDSVHYASSAQRKYLHLSAVFACNFVNHMYALAAEIVKEQQLDWSLLIPLIKETAHKTETMPPAKAQTGPAARGDERTLSKHLELLEGKDYKTLYRQISAHISKRKAATTKPSPH